MTQKTVSVATATIPISTALSDVIDFRGVSFMQIVMPAAWTAADLGFYVSATRDGTFGMLQDSGATRIECTGVAVNLRMQCPNTIAGSAFLKLWSQNAGVDANQAAERAIQIILKT